MQLKVLDTSVSTAPTTKLLSKFFLHSSVKLIKMFCKLWFFLYADKNGKKYFSMPQTIWSLFSTLTGLKFDISFLLGLPLSSGIANAGLAFSGKTFCAILELIAFVSNGFKKSAESFTSLGGIVSMPLVFFISRFFRRSLISLSLTVLKENLSLSEISDPLTTCLIFIMLG